MKRNKYNYRKIYTQFYGDIPLDENGVSYDIHHIDGDKCNNNVNNLKALSIDDHYKTHLKQKDWGACKALSMRVIVPQKFKAELTRKFHQGRKRSQSTKDKISKANLGRKQSELEREKRKFPRPGSGPQGPRSEETKVKMRKPKSEEAKINMRGKLKPGAGPQGPRSEETKVKMRKPKSSKGKEKNKIICPHCGTKGGEPIMKRWHFGNCKSIKK